MFFKRYGSHIADFPNWDSDVLAAFAEPLSRDALSSPVLLAARARAECSKQPKSKASLSIHS
jgi:hypothetical protein